jgi:cytochrome c553
VIILKKAAIAGSLLLSSPVFAGDPIAGRQEAYLCESCHGRAGISEGPMTPNLAGQKKDYLVKALKDFRSGARRNTFMSSVAASLSDNDINNVAAYFSNMKR